MHVLTARSISSKYAIPVDIIIGFPVFAILRINGISLISNDAILYTGTLSSSKKSTAVKSNGDEKNSNPHS